MALLPRLPHPCRGLILLVVLLVTAAAARAQTGQPDVYVEVEITADLYRSQLGSRIPGLESDLAAAVVDRLQRFDALDFVAWQVGPAPASAGEVNRLLLKLEGNDRPLGTEIRMRYISRVAGALENDLSGESELHFDPVVFKDIDEKYAQDAGRLETEIKRWLEQHIDESLGDDLIKYFLRFIAVATITPPTSLTAIDTGTNRLPMPIRYTSFYPHNESKFKAIFTSSFANNTGEGYMYLRPVGKLSAPGFDDDVLVRIACFGEEDACFSYPDVDIFSEEQIPARWTDIRDILSRDHLMRMNLFMERYVKDYYPNTDGALATEETPGSSR